MINFPIDCVTPNDRIEYCYIAQEALRIEHNSIGKDYRDGKINKSVFEAYVVARFKSKQRQIIDAMLAQKELLQKSARWSVDLNELDG